MKPIHLYATAVVTANGIGSSETADTVRKRYVNCRTQKTWLDRNDRPIVLGIIEEKKLLPLTEAVLSQDFLTERTGRLLQLAATALQADLLATVEKLPAKPPLFLSLPDLHGGSEIDAKKFLPWLALQTEEKFFDASQSLVAAGWAGRAGAIKTLVQAVGFLQANPGSLVLTGGVDCFDDPVILQRLELAKRLRTTRNLDGLIPGEGAGFLLLGDAQSGKLHNLTSIATIAFPSVGKETEALDNPEAQPGKGLAEVLKSLFADNPNLQPVTDFYTTKNGEFYWEKEFVEAFKPNKDAFASAVNKYEPAEIFGDIGAAFSPVLIALAAHGLHEKHYLTAPVLVYASSDTGDRAATLVSLPPEPTTEP
jgi:3-oxoacyl-[acyl-carrier-protein] synthase-1